jgi:archaellum component FlaC
MDNKPTTNDASSALAEAIDDFLGDLERKFKTVSDEILTKRESICPLDISRILSETADDRGGHSSGLEANVTVVDDMAERCDRIEAELLMRDAAGTGGSKSSLEEKSEG